MTGQQPYFIFRESACSSPPAPNNKERRHTEPALSAKLSRPAICSLEGGQHVSGREVPLDAVAGLYDPADQWAFAVREIGNGRGGDRLRPFGSVAVNPAFLTMVGYSTEELQQMSHPRHLCGWKTATNIEFRHANCAKACAFNVSSTTQYRRKDGTPLPVNTYLSVVSEHAPSQQTFLTLAVDVTSRQAAEDALRAAQSELGRIARLTTVDAMAASIAHELNQPLASIVTNGNAGIRWLDRPEPNLEETRSAFKRVVSEGHRAAQIIAGVRAMFRKDFKRESPVTINELVCDVVSTSAWRTKEFVGFRSR